MPGNFPNLTDIALPGVQGARPVAGVDPSGMGRGLQSLAQGVTNLGQGVEKAASEINEAKIAQDGRTIENGLASLSTTYLNNRDLYSQSGDPNSNQAWRDANTTARQKFDTQMQGLGPNALAHANARAGEMGAGENLHIDIHGHALRSSQAQADAQQRIDNAVGNAHYDWSGAPDPSRAQAFRSYQSWLTDQVNQGHVTAAQAQTYRQNYVRRYGEALVSDMISAAQEMWKTDPVRAEQMFGRVGQVLDWTLRARQGAPGTPGTTGAPGTTPPPTGGSPGTTGAPGTGGTGAPATRGVGAPTSVTGIISGAETGDTTLSPRALGNVSPDSNASRSYGFLGLNSKSGSAMAFREEFGKEFGLTADPGTPQFDAQWKTAAANQTDAFRAAQIRYFDEHIRPGVANDLTTRGIPENVANDPRVQAYFSDRKVQMNTVGLRSVTQAWATANGDVPTFLRNMNEIDRGNLTQNFPSALASGVYSVLGHDTRLNRRLNGALAIPAPGTTPTPGTAPTPGNDNTPDTANGIATPPPPDVAATGAQQQPPPGTQPPPNAPSLSQSDVELATMLRTFMTPGDRYNWDRRLEAARSAALANDRKANSQAEQDLKVGVANDYAAMSRDGTVSKGRSLQDFTAVYGDDKGREAFRFYADGLQYAADYHNLSSMTAEDQAALIHQYTPQNGDPDFAAKQQRVEGLMKAAGALHEELAQDPVQYMLKYNPAVRGAYMAIGQAQPDQQGLAAQTFASTMLDEQRRFGVPDSALKVVPQQYVDDLKTQMAQMTKDGNANLAWARMQQEREKWGKAWDPVYRQLSQGDPTLTVIGAGVLPAAGQLLLANKDRKFGELVGAENSASAKQIRTDVNDQMVDFHHSLAGSADGESLYGTVRAQVEKLAAIYVNQGMDETSAAKKAAADLLNFKYTYQDGYRVPSAKSGEAPPQSLDDIRFGAYAARNAIGTTLNGIDLSAKPTVNTLGAYTPEQLAEETANAKRTGHWATNHNESGLAYVYNGQVVYKPDGTPLQLTWAQLAALGAPLRSATQDLASVSANLMGAPLWEAPPPPRVQQRSAFSGSPFNAAGQPGRVGTQSGAAQTSPPSPAPPPLPPLTIPRELTPPPPLSDAEVLRRWRATGRSGPPDRALVERWRNRQLWPDR